MPQNERRQLIGDRTPLYIPPANQQVAVPQVTEQAAKPTQYTADQIVVEQRPPTAETGVLIDWEGLGSAAQRLVMSVHQKSLEELRDTRLAEAELLMQQSTDANLNAKTPLEAELAFRDSFSAFSEFFPEEMNPSKANIHQIRSQFIQMSPDDQALFLRIRDHTLQMNQQYLRFKVGEDYTRLASATGVDLPGGGTPINRPPVPEGAPKTPGQKDHDATANATAEGQYIDPDTWDRMNAQYLLSVPDAALTGFIATNNSKYAGRSLPDIQAEVTSTGRRLHMWEALTSGLYLEVIRSSTPQTLERNLYSLLIPVDEESRAAQALTNRILSMANDNALSVVKGLAEQDTEQGHKALQSAFYLPDQQKDYILSGLSDGTPMWRISRVMNALIGSEYGKDYTVNQIFELASGYRNGPGMLASEGREEMTTEGLKILDFLQHPTQPVFALNIQQQSNLAEARRIVNAVVAERFPKQELDNLPPDLRRGIELHAALEVMYQRISQKGEGVNPDTDNARDLRSTAITGIVKGSVDNWNLYNGNIVTDPHHLLDALNRNPIFNEPRGQWRVIKGMAATPFDSPGFAEGSAFRTMIDNDFAKGNEHDIRSPTPYDVSVADTLTFAPVVGVVRDELKKAMGDEWEALGGDRRANDILGIYLYRILEEQQPIRIYNDAILRQAAFKAGIQMMSNENPEQNLNTVVSWTKAKYRELLAAERNGETEMVLVFGRGNGSPRLGIRYQNEIISSAPMYPSMIAIAPYVVKKGSDYDYEFPFAVTPTPTTFDQGAVDSGDRQDIVYDIVDSTYNGTVAPKVAASYIPQEIVAETYDQNAPISLYSINDPDYDQYSWWERFLTLGVEVVGDKAANRIMDIMKLGKDLGAAALEPTNYPSPEMLDSMIDRELRTATEAVHEIIPKLAPVVKSFSPVVDMTTEYWTDAWNNLGTNVDQFTRDLIRSPQPPDEIPTPGLRYGFDPNDPLLFMVNKIAAKVNEAKDAALVDETLANELSKQRAFDLMIENKDTIPIPVNEVYKRILDLMPTKEAKIKASATIETILADEGIDLNSELSFVDLLQLIFNSYQKNR